MNAIEHINNNINPRIILEYYNFKRIKETSNEFRACCAIHGGDNDTAFVWKKTNNLWYCNTGDCGGGDIFTLIEKIEDVEFTEAVKIAGTILKLDITGMDIIYDAKYVERELQKWVDIMKRNKPVKLTKYEVPYTGATFKDIDRFSKEMCMNFNAMCTNIYPTEKKIYKNKLVIPIEFNHTVIAVQLRSLDESLPKWIIQPADIKLSNVLYNYDNVVQLIDAGECTEVILVEGIFDVWAYWEVGIKNVVCVFGSSVKPEQFDLLIKLGVDICLSFDNDKAGNKCTKNTIELFKNKVTLTKVDLPNEKDPCDCKEMLGELYKNKHYV